MNTWEKQLQEMTEVVNQALDRLLPPPDRYPEQIHQAMRYSVFAGGKRLRPVLVMGAAEAVGGSGEAVLPTACALELLHTYSLIHDDLPAMDNDDFRRGRLTNHKVYGEAIAILAGDALLTNAFELVSANRETAPAEAVIDCVRELSIGAGSLGMIGGQVVDLQSEGEAINRETLEYMHSHKTGALFRTAVRCGGILSGVGASGLAALTTYADNFGLAFQITDDILDVEGNEAVLGKPVGSDERNRKATYPALLGLEQARLTAARAVQEAVTALSVFGERGSFLADLARYVLLREK